MRPPAPAGPAGRGRATGRRGTDAGRSVTERIESMRGIWAALQRRMVLDLCTGRVLPYGEDGEGPHGGRRA